jgi:predicted nucleotidyltransferase
MAPTAMAATSICWSMRCLVQHCFDLGGLQDELESLLGLHVDLLTPGDLPPKFRAKVLAEAQPV